MTNQDRLSALEGRVRALEARLEHADEEAAVPTGPGREVLWALDGLHARVDDPGAVMLVGSVRLPDGRHAEWQQGAGTDELVGGDWTASSDALAALGHPLRLRLLQQVLAGVDTVHELTQIDGVGTSGQVYHHLRQLSSTGWLHALGGGRYEVPVARVVPLLVLVLGAGR
ncbi:ArsR family transcriptional regulator [Janibacter sp. GS2]|uniref:ArsR family transcriptional regulator n=1 Tax=Janibacter sp. GS2 TaxID=3442646 RepID=UPI003EB89C77